MTTNNAFAEWGDVFPHAACGGPSIDRLMHRAEVVGIDGKSYRQKFAADRRDSLARFMAGSLVPPDNTHVTRPRAGVRRLSVIAHPSRCGWLQRHSLAPHPLAEVVSHAAC